MRQNRRPRAHDPVLATEVVSFLVTNPSGAYLDLTVGLGGHLLAIVEAVDSAARLYGIDRDPEAVDFARQRLQGCAQVKRIEEASYTELTTTAAAWPDRRFDGILLDLGLSSDQLDDPERGFSFQLDGPLDMRFNPRSPDRHAADIINHFDRPRLTRIIREFGEERQAARLAAAIVVARKNAPLRTTGDLVRLVSQAVGPARLTKTLARVFQAFRIAVNRELDQIREVLPQALASLQPGGRLGVIAYHSLEDRIVKRFFKAEASDCLCPPRQPVCTCGHEAQLAILTRKPVEAGPDEVAANPRARSARLRVAERLAV